MRTSKSLNFTDVMLQMQAVAICIDDVGTVLDLSGESKIFGYGTLKLGQSFFDLMQREAGAKIKNILDSTISTSNTILSYSLVDNQRLRFNFSVNKVVEANGINYLLTFSKINNFLDEVKKIESNEGLINQLEASEERYNSFFENNPVMHVCVEPEKGLIIECNPFILEKMNCDSKYDIIGNPIYSIFTEKSKAKCLELLEEFRKNGAFQNEEMELLTKDGQIIHVLLHSNAHRDKNGKILYSRSTLVDITDIKNAEKLLQKKGAYLKLLNNELEQFVSTCSHDLQEPLATIKFAGDFIGKLYGDKLERKGNEYLSYIDEAVDRLSNQIRMLLEHAKIGRDAKKSEVDTNELLKTVIKDLGKRIVETKTNIKIPKKLPKIQAYETELRLLFQNLISNAIKYKKPNQISQIIITFKEFSEHTEFLIMDNGIGIAKKDINEVFKIFNKVNNSHPNKGTGIGLTHCKKIVQMHYGIIRVESSLGFGSTFSFTIKK